MMNSFVFRYVLLLSVSLLAVFGLHILILNYQQLPLFEHQIVKAYIVNYVLAVLIFFALFRLKKKFNDQLGFIFMGGSLLKFLFFFILLYPDYKADQKLQTIEFVSFFVPYSFSLLIETLAVIKILNK